MIAEYICEICLEEVDHPTIDWCETREGQVRYLCDYCIGVIDKYRDLSLATAPACCDREIIGLEGLEANEQDE